MCKALKKMQSDSGINTQEVTIFYSTLQPSYENEVEDVPICSFRVKRHRKHLL